MQPRFDMPTDTQDHCSNLHGIWLDTRDAMRAFAAGIYFHVIPTRREPYRYTQGGNESQRSEQELSVKLVKFNFDFSSHESPWDVTVPAMTNGLCFEHKSRTPRPSLREELNDSSRSFIDSKPTAARAHQAAIRSSFFLIQTSYSVSVFELSDPCFQS